MLTNVSEKGWGWGTCEECQVYNATTVLKFESGKSFGVCRRCLDVLRDQLKKALKEQDALTAEWRKRQVRNDVNCVGDHSGADDTTFCREGADGGG